MDWLKLHLALNHISVIGTPFLFALLGWGWIRRNAEITRLALWWIVWFAGLSILLKFTGDFAAEQYAKELEPVSSFVQRHEQSADQATTAIFLLGLAAAATLFISKGGQPLPKWAVLAVLGMALLSCILLARTANIGGQISHPELRAANAVCPRGPGPGPAL